ncbi:MAG: hypothetical protein AB7G93_06955 [Bdellovibrionales bacterium]
MKVLNAMNTMNTMSTMSTMNAVNAVRAMKAVNAVNAMTAGTAMSAVKVRIFGVFVALVAVVLVVGETEVSAQPIRAGCPTREARTFTSREFLDQFVAASRLVSFDCEAFTDGSGKELLLTVLVLNSSVAVETYVGVFAREGFGPQSKALAKTGAIGFESFPMQIDSNRRLVFMLPKEDAPIPSFYLNTQVAPQTTQFWRWEYSGPSEGIKSVRTRTLSMEAGTLPKIFPDQDKWRALIVDRATEI